MNPADNEENFLGDPDAWKDNLSSGAVVLHFLAPRDFVLFPPANFIGFRLMVQLIRSEIARRGLIAKIVELPGMTLNGGWLICGTSEPLAMCRALHATFDAVPIANYEQRKLWEFVSLRYLQPGTDQFSIYHLTDKEPREPLTSIQLAEAIKLEMTRSAEELQELHRQCDERISRRTGIPPQPPTP